MRRAILAVNVASGNDQKSRGEDPRDDGSLKFFLEYGYKVANAMQPGDNKSQWVRKLRGFSRLKDDEDYEKGIG